jgi:transcriptional regulator with XRE-family HTH domain
MNEQLKHFGRNVIAHMAKQQIVSSELAKRAGISPKTLNNLLKGRHAPQLDVLTKIAGALKVDLWQLWLPEVRIFAEGSNDDVFPRLVETASKLSPEALKAVARVADLELRADRPD